MSDEFPRMLEPEDKIDDANFGDAIIKGVETDSNGSGYTIHLDKAGSMGIPHIDGIAPPEVDDRVRVWDPPLLGNTIRGVALRGTVLFYRSPEQTAARRAKQAAEIDAERKQQYEEEKPKLQAIYEKLPEAFQRRLDKYRNGPNPDFGWEHEGYELFCCEQAVVFAERAKRAVVAANGDSAEVAAYYESKTEKETPPTPELRWLYWWNALYSAETNYDKAALEKHKEEMPGRSDDHSGNTWETAFSLAVIWLRPDEEAGDMGVINRFGALAPLVGSEAYGDPPEPVSAS